MTSAHDSEVHRLREENDYLRSILRDEPPGTLKAIVAGMFDAAEERGHSRYSAKHAMSFLLSLCDRKASEI